jgi:hypothetical protein
MPLVIVMLSLETQSICIMCEKLDGSSLVRTFLPISSPINALTLFVGNYDVTKLHYEGPGNVPGAVPGGYGYEPRVRA